MPPVLALSALAAAGHAAVFVVAARAVGVDAAAGTARAHRAGRSWWWPRSRSTWPAGVPARAPPPGPSPRPVSARPRGRPWPWRTASSRSWRPCRAPSCSLYAAGPAARRRLEARGGGGARVADRPYILLSCGMSIDGYLDNASSKRLLLSNQADLERVDAVRAASRRDPGGRPDRTPGQPAAARAQRRVAATSGSPAACRRPRPRSPSPHGARLDPRARFFATGQTDKLVYCARPAVARGPRARSATSRPSSTAVRRSGCGDWSRTCTTAAPAG